jgi:hypothetical protein
MALACDLLGVGEELMVLVIIPFSLLINKGCSSCCVALKLWIIDLSRNHARLFYSLKAL